MSEIVGEIIIVAIFDINYILYYINLMIGTGHTFSVSKWTNLLVESNVDPKVGQVLSRKDLIPQDCLLLVNLSFPFDSI